MFDRTHPFAYHGHMSALHPSFRAILFDLDGTLLQVDMRRYIPAYVQGLAATIADTVPHSEAGRTLLGLVHHLLQRDSGDESNNSWYLQHAAQTFGMTPQLLSERFATYFASGLTALDPLMSPTPAARRLAETCIAKGWKVVIATNPVFPQPVIDSRLRRAGLADLDLALVTTSDNSRRCKPNPAYFADIMARLDLNPEQCLMVGNDTGHDLAARQAGIATFLVDTWMIDRAGGDFVSDYRGNHATLQQFLENLANVAED